MCNMMMMYEQTRSCYCRIGRIKTTEQVQIEYHTQTHTRAKNVGSQNGIDVRTETEKRHTTKDKDGTKKNGTKSKGETDETYCASNDGIRMKFFCRKKCSKVIIHFCVPVKYR